jgi:hypothetical protein
MISLGIHNFLRIQWEKGQAGIRLVTQGETG